MQELTTLEAFNEVINRDKTTIVKFYTTWCPDCTRMNMFIEPIIKEHADKDWYQLNKDNIEDVAIKYDVMGIPSLLVFKNGEKIGHLHSANAKTSEEVREFLSQFN